ncbi:hypothetical protein ACJ41O_010331 [Fusarium nematophilum]
MSCNTTGVISLLSSAFLDPSIPCNVCGAWMQGAFAIIESDLVKGPHILVRILMSRSPKLGFLWLGGVLIGIQGYIMRWARPVAFLMDLHAAAWTGTVVSFVQDPVPKLTQDAAAMSRSDEARLMFLSQAEYHTQPPTAPFGPFGIIAIKDCILEVQLHAHCPGRHALRYAGWAWNCTNGTRTAQDPADVSTVPTTAATEGPVLTSSIPVQYDGLNRERDCSESMTRNMFLWLRGTDGFPIAEREIFEHEWIGGWDSDDESVAPEGDGKSTAGRPVGRWMSRVVTHRRNTL